MPKDGSVLGSTLSMHMEYQHHMKRVRDNVATNEKQIHSGKKTEKFTDLGKEGTLQYMMALESKRTELQSSIESNNAVIDRMSAIYISLRQIIEVAGAFRASLASAQSLPNFEKMELNSLSRNNLATIRDNLNSSYAGRYLFAGSRIKSPPVGKIDTQTNILQGQHTANYYSGDNVVAVANVNVNLQIEYGITANDPAFINLISAHHIAIEARDKRDLSLINAAFEKINAAISGLTELQAKLGNNMRTIESVTEQYQSLNEYATNSLAKIVNADPLQTSIDLNNNIVALQASFKSYASTQDLSLVNYLK